MTERAIIIIDKVRQLSKVYSYLHSLKELNIVSLILLYRPPFLLFSTIAQHEALKRFLQEDGFKVSEHLLLGSLLSECLHISEKENTSLIVHCTEGPLLNLSNTKLGELLTIPVQCELLVNKKAPFSLLSHLLFYTDFSPASKRAFNRLLLLISSVNFAKITLLSIHEKAYCNDHIVLERQKLEVLGQQVKSVGAARVQRLSLCGECNKVLSQVIEEQSISLLVLKGVKPSRHSLFRKRKDDDIKLKKIGIPSLQFIHSDDS